MIAQFFISDLLLKNGVPKKRVLLIISISQIVLYVLLLLIFYRLFHSLTSLIVPIPIFLFAYFVRMNYVKKYLATR